MCFQKVPGKHNSHHVIIFALSTCGWCRKTKEYLKEKQVEYQYTDVDKLPMPKIHEVRRKIKKYNPRGSFPTIVIDETHVIIGYRPDEIEEVLDK